MSKANLFKRGMAALLVLAMIFAFLPVIPFTIHAEESEVATSRLNRDATTQGQWIGKYGSDTAILLGYKSDASTHTYDSTKGGRYLFDRTQYNLQVDNIETPYLTSFYPSTAGYLWSYSAVNEKSVLQMPEVEGAGGTAFSAYLLTEGGSSTIESGSPSEGCYEGWIYKNVSFKLNDSDSHVLSIYCDRKLSVPGHILIVDEDGTILASDDLEAGEFDGGVYLSYLVSVKEAGKKIYVFFGSSVGNGIGISALFFDTIGSLTDDLTATAGENGIELSWVLTGKTNIGESSICIERRAANTDVWNTLISTSETAATGYVDTNVEEGVTYEYRISTICLGVKVEDSVATVSTSKMFNRVNIDNGRENMCDWEGTYGSDVSVLFGYNYPSLNDGAIPTTGTIQNNSQYMGNHYQNKSTSGSYFTNWSWYVQGELMTFGEAAEDNIAVLNMPAEFNGAYKKFAAFNKGKNVTDLTKYYIYGYDSTSKGWVEPILAGLAGTDAESTDSGGYRFTAYKFTLADSDPHLFTIYGNGTFYGKEVKVYFLSADGSQLLGTDLIEANTFNTGAYATYMVQGSFVMVTKTRYSTADGINGFFFDSVNSLTQSLTATPVDEGVELKWEPTGKTNAFLENNIRIDRRVADNNLWKTLTTISDTEVTTYVDESAVAGETYEYRIYTLCGDIKLLDDSVSVANVKEYIVHEDGNVFDILGNPVVNNEITFSGVLNMNGNSATVKITGENTVLAVVDTSLIPEGGAADLTGSKAGKLTVDEGSTGTIKDWDQYGNYKYLKVDEGSNVYSFHPFNLVITRMGLNTVNPAICIQVTFVADDVVKTLLMTDRNEYGLKNLSASAETPYSNAKEKEHYQFGESNGVRAYFDLTGSLEKDNFEKTGEFKAYMKIGETEILSNFTLEVNPKQVLTDLNGMEDVAPTETQLERIQTIMADRSWVAEVLTRFNEVEE